MTPGDPIAAVLEGVRASRRYGRLAPELLRRLAAEELPKARTPAEAEKRVKRRLHQIFGAYATRPNYTAILAGLRAAAGDPDAVRGICRSAMAAHASTRERLPILDVFYREVFAVTGRPTSLLDIGCGLNPLAAPWMDLAPATPYRAIDIDLDLVAFLTAALPLLGADGSAETRDVVATPPEDPADVALLLKTLPCLEQQRAGTGERLLRAIRARRIVVSYPTHSLGGRGKGMERTYRDTFARLAETLEQRYETLAFPGEVVFVVASDRPSA